MLESHCEGNSHDFAVVAPEVQHAETIDSSEELSPCDIYGCFDPTQVSEIYNYDLALDMGITRKQISTSSKIINNMSQEDYMSLMRSLNAKQLAFF